MSHHSLNIDTICVHAGLKESPEGAVVTPIFQTSTFKFQSADHGARLFNGEEEGYIYTRMRNPTVEAMEDAVAALEGGVKAIGCASGMAAVHLIIASTLKTGDHVICSEAVYGPTVTILKDLFTHYNVDTTFVDTSNLAAIEAAFKPNTKLVHIETPGNPTLIMADIKAIADMSHCRGAKLSVDSTFMSPVYQRPFEFGADYIMHSMTKFLNGHADVVAGIVVLNDIAEYKHFRKMSNLIGGVIDPFNSFLVHRGLKTLALRVRKQAENAQKVAEYLENHPKVDWVRFPGLKSHPQYELGLKQMTGHGSMIALELKGGYDAGKKLMDTIELFVLAVSLGGVESLIQHPASMTHNSMGKEAREQAHITDGLVRIAIGIEDADDLIAALDKGLAGI
ncbi:MAG: aminotransferase class I/II-fold pyridoxal phosphate-dependent enzyme [Candidatus Kapabacteria bacterium]|nr:aminotransferase class I/II-fold pyridoxal phosphate-dependent enzyme [Ignavibacteriota bacterium]MCW5884716.1 aminotransferase class I/II-fold pyridoxal phosphate-dependent enzyme [Candidatus Kapabacteria bacterium]